MGFLDDIEGGISGLLSQGGGGQSTNIVGALLGGNATGGVGSLVQTLAANGLADKVAAWTGGQNSPISPQEIQSALGSDQVQQMASSAGLPVGDFLKHLSDHLPAAAAAANQ